MLFGEWLYEFQYTFLKNTEAFKIPCTFAWIIPLNYSGWETRISKNIYVGRLTLVQQNTMKSISFAFLFVHLSIRH